MGRNFYRVNTERKDLNTLKRISLLTAALLIGTTIAIGITTATECYEDECPQAGAYASADGISIQTGTSAYFKDKISAGADAQAYAYGKNTKTHTMAFAQKRKLEIDSMAATFGDKYSETASGVYINQGKAGAYSSAYSEGNSASAKTSAGASGGKKASSVSASASRPGKAASTSVALAEDCECSCYGNYENCCDTNNECCCNNNKNNECCSN